jgi:hypothetical protein
VRIAFRRRGDRGCAAPPAVAELVAALCLFTNEKIRRRESANQRIEKIVEYIEKFSKSAN